MGLVESKDGKQHQVLTDIQGIEDALGDMDFKVAGTSEGVTGLQLDLKTAGLAFEIMEEAFAQAREARLFILDKMAGSAGRASTSAFQLRPAHTPHQDQP